MRRPWAKGHWWPGDGGRQVDRLSSRAYRRNMACWHLDFRTSDHQDHNIIALWGFKPLFVVTYYSNNRKLKTFFIIFGDIRTLFLQYFFPTPFSLSSSSGTPKAWYPWCPVVICSSLNLPSTFVLLFRLDDFYWFFSSLTAISNLLLSPSKAFFISVIVPFSSRVGTWFSSICSLNSDYVFVGSVSSYFPLTL